MFDYAFHPAAEKELSRLPLQDQERVIDRLNTLRYEAHPVRSHHVIKLEGYHHPTYRLRVGNWRVVFMVRNRTFYILSVRPRQRGYRPH